jgi:hypothetical protein
MGNAFTNLVVTQEGTIPLYSCVTYAQMSGLCKSGLDSPYSLCGPSSCTREHAKVNSVPPRQYHSVPRYIVIRRTVTCCTLRRLYPLYPLDMRLDWPQNRSKVTAENKCLWTYWRSKTCSPARSWSLAVRCILHRPKLIALTYCVSQHSHIPPFSPPNTTTTSWPVFELGYVTYLQNMFHLTAWRGVKMEAEFLIWIRERGPLRKLLHLYTASGRQNGKCDALNEGWPTLGPRAACGPPGKYLRPLVTWKFQ